MVKGKFVDDTEIQKVRNRVLKYLESKEPLIFLVGPVGSGKSENSQIIIETLLKNRKKASLVKFNPGKSYEQVLLNSIPLFTRLIISLVYLFLGSVFWYFISGYLQKIESETKFPITEFLLITLSFLSYVLLIDRTDSISLAYFRFLKYFKRVEAIFLDDLDRTSLDINNIFQIVMCIKKSGIKSVVVNLGYSDDVEKFRYLDFGFKLNGKLEELPNSPLVNVSLLGALLKGNPFMGSKNPEFLRLFTPRQIIEIAETVKKMNYNEKELEMLVCLHIFIHRVFNQLNYGQPEIDNLAFSDSNGRFAIKYADRNKFTPSREHQKLLDSIPGSLAFEIDYNSELSAAKELNNLRFSSIDLVSIRKIIK